MSHAPERKEKDCLNCGTIVHGRFCHVCGQENLVPKETFGSMVVHFFNDITHFDGKLFKSLKWLVRKPGFLSSEYIAGRRASYLHPIRMYVFTSALFFIILFSLFSAENIKMSGLDSGKGTKAANEFSAEAYKNAKTKEDSLEIAKALILVNPPTETKIDTIDNRLKAGITVGEAANKYKTVAAYDSAQALLPASERDNWLEKQINRRSISLRQKYGDNNAQLLKDLLSKFIHSFPYMLFVSLPLYALWLKLLYWRRKQFYYADHGLFLIHLYIFTFLLLILFFAFDKLENMTGLGLWKFLKVISVLYGIYYTYRAMKNFYRQRAGKTVLKFILLNILCLVSLIILFGAFFIFSFYRV